MLKLDSIEEMGVSNYFEYSIKSRTVQKMGHKSTAEINLLLVDSISGS